MSTISKTAFIKSCQKIDQKLIKKNCPMKYKMFTANGFHKDFQFWAQKGSLRGPDHLTPQVPENQA